MHQVTPGILLDGRADFPALDLASTPRLAVRLSRLVLISVLFLPFALLFVPWTQTVHGEGRAIAFNPVERPQFIVSPIEGRIKKWYVAEGDRVQAGQRILEMVDNDPNLELRLLDEERAILDRLRAAEARVRDIEARIRNLQNSRQLAIDIQTNILRQEEARLFSFKQQLIAAEARLAAAEPNYRRQKELFENRLAGLASKRDVEVAERELGEARAQVEAAKAQIALAEEAVKAAKANLEKVDADTAAMINLETASLRAAEAEVATIRRDKAQIEVRIARQRAQYVDAPTDGVIFRLLANAEQGGILVRPGERLAVLVPDIKGPDREGGLTKTDYPGIVTELNIDGNDLPLIRKGDRVRLQFEGWPAVQFVGWPSVAVGTFGGRVYLVDPTADEYGRFRILVEPDPEDQPWPEQEYLRQGVRAQGWVLLRQVTLGWELWRQLNGFPPTRDPEEAKTGGGGSLGPVKPKSAK
ncbi:MAG: HlyD family secretion protein [Gemmatales bacterium]|nr:HlyD family secretion protein [Gemmatales bacterium]MDW8386911.1 biotin/lipoyl-binding protein [Gemmatales bacterium]